MAVIYNINGTSALKPQGSRFKVIDCNERAAKPTNKSARSAAKEALLFQDNRLFDDSAIDRNRAAQCKINPVLLGVASTAITFALCLISTVL